MNLNNGKHIIMFKDNKLYLDNVQIAGDGIIPSKSVILEFIVNKPEEKNDPSVLSINVSDSMNIQGIGPGQN